MEKETFATAIGCMDGRSQEPTAAFAREKTEAQYVDVITDAGIVSRFAEDTADEDFLESIRDQVAISVVNHESKGIVVSAHAECAGNPIPDEEQIDQLRLAVEVIKGLVPEGYSVPVLLLL